MDKNEKHSALVNEILVELSKNKNIRVWKQHVGKFRDFYNSDRIISVGRPGMADISGIINFRGLGLKIEIEVKTGNAFQNKDQKVWEKIIKSMGGHYIVARSVNDAKIYCEKILEG